MSASGTTVQRIVVMGVSGSGKSTIGELLAERLDVPFVDADSLHPLTNVEKMEQGIPLDDDDRWPWLQAVGEHIAAASGGIVVACSALKRSYRDRIRSAAPDVRFAYLEGDQGLLAARMAARHNHFMPPSLLDSQLATLEPLASDEAGVTVSTAATPQQITESIARRLE